ncbi:MAG TPA: low molecular weight protein-tyrosine-phosphatase [Chitinophagaceae bacterium]|nr:low molecular weight protein-tyrosine-phosphatase [Chitinophagaceae bacterium]
MKILMVCLGNICRSPLAEGILQDKAWKAGLKWSVESAGTNDYHIGEAPHPLSQKVAKLNGIDICNQRKRKFVAEDFNRFDKIYAMSADVIDEMKSIAKKSFDEKKVDLLLNELFPGQNVDVPDPWYGPEPGFHQAYKLIEEACEAIIKKASPNPSHGGDFQASLKSKTINGNS